MRPTRALGAAVLLGVLTLAGCGQSGTSGTSSKDSAAPAGSAPAASQAPAAGAFPVTVKGGDGDVTVPAKPVRIVSLSPTATETLYAVGAGEQVVAVDDQSDFPAGAPKTKLSGFKPNAEAVIGYKPDLVVLSNDTAGVAAALRKLKVPVLLQSPATKIDDVYTQITNLGTATGHADQAKTVVEGMKSQIAQAVEQAGQAKAAKELTYYHELSPDLYTVTSDTFVGQVYSLFGLKNIADGVDDKAGGYPKLSAEHAVKADPDLVFLADTVCCGQNAETVARRTGWKDLSAVKKGLVIPVNDSLASRWGPRLPEFVKIVGDAVRKAAAAK
ncbi:ABC transporter substrate-binding protein [Bailinhaonella thermotolerans]|uniref:ABC transporter substrate-binding protein n=1 Tax=Bailinhaonella thermotolerans TaxID=1070861 RepID=A0A3A4A0I1_9ACTN|nr:ABC transporter substrate-binding protein [Bailinhaonella thermotolerans]RJL21423.1 ABC transporter substrate-binding protein [Bailinhaonella thermotolerans]